MGAQGPRQATPADASAYARIRYRLLLLDLAAGAMILVGLQWSGWSHALANGWRQLTDAPGLVLCGYLVVFGVGSTLLMAPLKFYRGFILEHRFGLSRLTVRGWLVREAKQLAVSGVLSLLVLEGLYALLRLTPTMWPVWATLGWVAFSVILARVFPTVLLPIFYKTSPLPDKALVDRLLALCERVGMSALGVFRFDLGAETRKANAALAGLGATRRILLSDTLVANFTPEEIEGVLAHELAHHHYHHIVKLLGLSALGSWVTFTLTNMVGDAWVGALGLSGLADVAGWPILMLCFSALGLMGLPLQNAISRRFEWEADQFAVATTGLPQAFAGALRRLAELNLADPNPPRWVTWLFYDHPPITERIEAAEAVSTS